MDDVDRAIVNALQRDFPICAAPFSAAGAPIGVSGSEIVDRLSRLLADGTLTRFGPLFQAERLGGELCLCAMCVPVERFEEVAETVNGFPEVAHNYERAHAYNMWFVVATERPGRLREVVSTIEAATGIPVLALPKEREYFVGLHFHV